jgi:hypothetical protein
LIEAMADDLCIHENDPSWCTICLGKAGPASPRASSTVSTDRFLDCLVCGRSLPETKFPTDKHGERAEGRCRECRDFLVAKRKEGADDDEAIAVRRRQFPGQRSTS